MISEVGYQLTLSDLTTCIRPIIKAPAGKKVVLADFKSVENRVLFWLADCKDGMRLYAEGKDPYIDFASRLNDLPYEEISKEQRQIAKPGTLGCGFGLGGGRENRIAKCTVCKKVGNVKLEAPQGETFDCPFCHARAYVVGEIRKTGLWRYAEMMGIELTQEQAQKQVNIFRDAFMEVCELWYFLENAYVAGVNSKRPQHVGQDANGKWILTFRYQDPALRIVLPSGRELVYNLPFAFESRDDRGFKQLSLGFDGLKGKAWLRQSTYGGRLCENVVQGIALDLLVDSMFLAEADSGLELVGHTHDEIIALADADDATAVQRLEGHMSQTPDWAPGLLMAADGYEGERYAKG